MTDQTAASTGQTETNTELETYARQQAALVHLSAELAATLDETEICRALVHGLHNTLGYEHVGLLWVDETTGDRVLRASIGWPDTPSEWRIPPGKGVTERAILSGQLYYTPDVTQDPDYIPALGIGAEVNVPLRVGDKVMGVLVVERDRPNAFDQNDFAVLTAAVNQTSVALERARKHQAVKEAEVRYRSLFDGVPVGLYRTTPDGQFLDANQAIVEMLGYPDHASLLATNAIDVHLNTRERREWQERVEREGTVRDFELQIRRYDGTVIWMRDIARAVRDSAGQTLYYEGSLVDITEQVRAEAALRESEEKFRMLAEKSPNMIFINKERRVVYANEVCEEIMGYTRQELLAPDFDFRTLVAPEHVELVESHYHSHMQGQQVPSYEYLLVTKDGKNINAIHTTRLITYEGKPAILGIITEVTERKRAEEKIRRRNRELTLLNRVIAATTSKLDAAMALKVVCRELAHAFQVTQVTAALLNAEGTKVTVVAEHRPGSPSGIGITVPLENNSAAAYVMRHKTPLAITNAQTDERVAPIHALLRERNAASLLTLPIIERGDKIAGFIGIATPERHEFSEQEIALAQNVAAAAGQALETAQLHQAIQSHAERLEVLHEIDQAILQARSLEEIVRAALGHLLRLTSCRRVSVAVINFETQKATLFALEPDQETELQSETIPSLAPFSDIIETIQQGDRFLTDDISVLPHDNPIIQALRAEGFRSFIAVPLTFGDELMGSLNLLDNSLDVFTPEHSQVAREVANSLAVAIRQAQLRDELERYAENLEALVKERTAELHVALEQAQGADRVKSEFVSNVSHELRAPLTNIKLYLSLLTHGRQDKHAAYLATLQRETERLRVLIEGLLDLSRLDLGKIQVHLQPTDVNLAVGTLATDRGALIADRGLRLDVALAEGLPLALADTKLLEQVLTNLLTNAVNYTPSGGDISLRTRTDKAEGKEWITISVADTGPGIAAQERPHLFERFFRGQVGQNSDAAGTGLGLPICKEIVELHQGRITLESEPGQGSTFTVWLQIASSAEGLG